MILCPKCGTELSDTAKFCRKCGTKIEMARPESDQGIEETYQWGPPTGDEDAGKDQSMMPVAFAGSGSALEEVDEEEYRYEGEGVIPPWDHTHEFDEDDISENKVIALAAYILGPIGIIIALLAAQSSPYVGFHLRQGLKLIVVEALTTIVMLLLCWTFIVPAAAGIFLIVLMVIRVIAFVSVCRGRAIELPIVRELKFLK